MCTGAGEAHLGQHLPEPRTGDGDCGHSQFQENISCHLTSVSLIDHPCLKGYPLYHTFAV